MTKRAVVAIALALVVSSTRSAVTEVSLPRPNQNWIELRTANFRFFSNAGRSATRQVAVDLEELRAVLATLTDYELQSPVPTFIYVFKGERSFLPFKVLYRQQPAAVTGYFIATENANYIALDAAAADASAIIYHEYVHYLANNNLWYLPLWFSEGLAEFYESFTVDGRTVYIGLPILRHLQTLRGSTPIPLEELVTVDRDSELYNEADRKGIFYAQSWALVHYLMLGDETRRQQLSVYLARVRGGVPEAAAFDEAFATDHASLAAELRQYLRSLRFPSIQTRTDIDLDREFEIRKLSYAEVLYRLGDLLASHQPDRPERLAYFEASIEADPEYGLALSALAVEAERRADWDTARRLHEHAARLSPSEATVFYRWGEFLGHRGGDYRQAAAVLTRSAELNPSFVPVWATLAAVYTDAGDTSEAAIDAVRTAYAMRPYDIPAARDLMRLYLRLDRRSEAVSLIERAFRFDSRLQAEAWTAVIEHDLLQARRLLQDDRATQALQVLSLAEAVAEQSLYPEQSRREIEWTRSTIDRHRAADLLRLAKERSAAEDKDAARDLLEQALQISPEGPVASACRNLLDVIDHPERGTDAEAAALETSPTADEIARLNQLIVTKDWHEALQFLDAMRNRVGSLQQEWIDDRKREIQRAVDYEDFVDQYNHAVDLYNQQRYEEAVEVLESLLQTLPEGQEASEARALLADALAKIN